jgi:RecB family exonuclease
VRPRRLSVTEIQTLIRDPYTIYARHVLGLLPLEPLRPEPDTKVQGTVFHRILQDFVTATLTVPDLLTRAALLDTADAVLAVSAHWPGIRHVWRGRIEGFADWFVALETARRLDARPMVVEEKVKYRLSDPDFVLVGKPDRIDLRQDGTAEILDYKTGALPSKTDIAHFDRQLMLLAVMAESGAFGGPPGLTVSRVAHVGLGSDPKLSETPVAAGETAETRTRLSALLTAWLDPAKGFSARRAKEGSRWDGDYDHLARYGEWSAADEARPEDVG